jgi:penicillin-binding protein 1A
VLSAIRQRSDGAVELPRPEARRVMSAEEAYLVTSLLQSVVEEGTGEPARRLGRPIAAKTGTTNLAKDAWFVGYSTDLSVAVWVGYDDALPLGPQESGARTAGPAFVDFMQAAHEGHPVSEFPRPDGIVTLRVDPPTGLLPWPEQPNAVPEEFLAGTEPEQHAVAPAGLIVPIR